MKQENLRAYFFQNMYLQGIQAGIQTQHTTTEMFVKYIIRGGSCYTKKEAIFDDWVCDHKTTIVLNGGMSGDLLELEKLLSSEDNPYPWSSFRESEYALNGALTNVGIILPEKVYSYYKLSEEIQEEVCLSEWEMELVAVLSSKRLMN